MPYSYLSYSDDYILDVTPTVQKTGKKFISFPETQHVQGTIQLRGTTRLPVNSEQIVVRASAYESTTQAVSYKGVVNSMHTIDTVTGSGSRNVKSKAMFIGSKSKTISESVMIKGKKDYVVLINKIQKVLELEEPFGPYDDFDDCVRDQISKGKDANAARSICGALQRDLKEDYDEYDWGDKVEEAKYQGRTVKLNKPFRTSGGPKKFAVYVMNKQGNVVIVRFGDPNMSIKRDDPERRKSFRARHNCSQKKDRTTPGYWSCKFWSSKRVGDLA